MHHRNIYFQKQSIHKEYLESSGVGETNQQFNDGDTLYRYIEYGNGTLKNWEEARKICQTTKPTVSLGTDQKCDLAAPSTLEEHKFIISKLEKVSRLTITTAGKAAERIWIGFQRAQDSSFPDLSAWKWANGDATTSYSGWATTGLSGKPQPDREDEFCAIMARGDSMKWNDVECGRSFNAFLCECK